MTRLWLRADASATIGFGHAMRMLAVAEAALASGHGVTFVTAGPAGASRATARHGIDVVSLDDTADLAWARGVAPGDAVLFDGYGFGPDDFAAVTAPGVRTGAVDDFARGAFDVNVVVNPNPADAHEYETKPGAQVLLGPRYAMVRAEFRAFRRLRAGRAGTLLLTFGGSDPGGLTPVALRALASAPSFERVVALLGPAAPAVDRPPGGQVAVVRDPPEVARVFDAADAVVTAAGSTTWEVLTMGLPAALVVVADNQALVARAATHAHAALSVGTGADVESALPAVVARLADAAEQRALSAAALDLVDGLGASRVVDALFDG